MPLFQETPRGPAVDVRASVAVELDWVLATAHSLGRAGTPALESMYRQYPALTVAVLGLWGPDETLTYPGYLELSVLAQRAGVLFTTDGEQFLAAIDGAARAGGADLPFLAEKPDDRSKLHRRLDILRRSPARRRRYVEVVSEVWSRVHSEWERVGLPAVNTTIADVTAQLQKGRPWEQFVKSECIPADDVMAGIGPRGEVVIVPAWFTHGGMLVDLPDLVVIGVRADSSGAGSRARTEALSRQLKVISDPTRLAILDTLQREEMTVTELAGRFSLAQPTVSNHVKVLRDAGVVTETRSSSKRVLSVEHSVVEGIVRELQNLIGSESGPG